jgi:hypothetical protein
MVKKIKVIDIILDSNENEEMNKTIEEMKINEEMNKNIEEMKINEDQPIVEPTDTVVMKTKRKTQSKVEEMKIHEEMNEDQPIVEPTDTVVMKTKRKTKSKVEEVKKYLDNITVSFDSNKTIIKDPIINDIDVLEIEEPNGIIKNQNIKITELVECPDCHKKMTLKTLKYSHKNNCQVNKPSEQLPKEAKLQTHVAEKPNIVVEIPEK